MNCGKGSKSWVLVWVASILVGGLILYKAYQSSLSIFIHERVAKITRQTAQAVSARTTQVAGDGEAALLLHRDQKLVLEQADLSTRPRSIKDFPSPVQGNLLRSVGNYYSEAFGNYLFHAGTDYAEPEGTMIRATHGGKVVFVGLDPILGQKVTLDCGEGWLVTYGGLDNLRVQDGETVVTGEALGQVGFFPGAEGQSDQPQLHYEVWQGNEVKRP